MKGTALADAALLVLRSSLAIPMGAQGLRKTFGWWGGEGLRSFQLDLAARGIPTEAFLGVPLNESLGFLVALAETGGSVLLLLGFLARFAALSHAVIMIGAIVLATGSGGWFLPRGVEYSVALLGLAVGILLLGPGSWALRLTRAR
jgi:putative oxidoreductase